MTLAHDVVPLLAENNHKLVCIGIGTSERAQEFCEHVAFPVDKLYADPDNIQRRTRTPNHHLLAGFFWEHFTQFLS